MVKGVGKSPVTSPLNGAIGELFAIGFGTVVPEV
jgi:hypothetical protein